MALNGLLPEMSEMSAQPERVEIPDGLRRLYPQQKTESPLREHFVPNAPVGYSLSVGTVININESLKYRVTKIMARGRVMMKEV